MDTYTEEKAIQKFHSHVLHYFHIYFVGVIFVALGIIWQWPMIILGIMMFFVADIVRKATTFYVLDDGIARGYRLLSTDRKYIEYDNIQNVEVTQSFFQNIIGVGDLKFDTSGSDAIEIEFTAVAKPYSIEKIIREKMVSK